MAPQARMGDVGSLGHHHGFVAFGRWDAVAVIRN
jgi:hypothetical protein